MPTITSLKNHSTKKVANTQLRNAGIVFPLARCHVYKSLRLQTLQRSPSVPLSKHVEDGRCEREEGIKISMLFHSTSGLPKREAAEGSTLPPRCELPEAAPGGRPPPERPPARAPARAAPPQGDRAARPALGPAAPAPGRPAPTSEVLDPRASWSRRRQLAVAAATARTRGLVRPFVCPTPRSCPFRGPRPPWRRPPRPVTSAAPAQPRRPARASARAARPATGLPRRGPRGA